MKREIEVSAKTKEEAIAKAVEELGAPSESALFITVINEGRKGFLGFGSVDATIKAVYQIPDAPAEKKERRDRSDRRDRNRRGDHRDRAPRNTEAAAAEHTEGETAEHLPGELPVRQPKNKTRQNQPKVRKTYENVDPATVKDSERMAYEFIVNLVANMGLQDVDIAMHPGDNDDMVITVDGEAAGVLIGHHGDTLDALQYLANLAANKKEEGEKREYARITVDVESYRAKREDALRALARKKANQVLKYKKSIMLEPMNPYERRIIHSEIQHMEGVTTNSIGTDNNRRIVIFLEDEGMPETEAVKAAGAGEKSGRSRNRRRRKSSGATVDPLAGSGRVMPTTSTFDEDDVKDPFDIDLSAATYSEEDEEDVVEPVKDDLFSVPDLSEDAAEDENN